MTRQPSPQASRFRNRKLNPRQTLPIIKAADVPDFDLSSRAIPEMETGVDKEEES
ncbi:hypothetical protein BC936DRAFT_142447, partial [Jimgerdemannia flammicorona]